MNGLQGIRNINAARRGENVPALRYQRQYQGSNWRVFDSHTGGWGFQSANVQEVDDRVDELNYGELLTKRTPLDVVAQQDAHGAANAVKAGS